jgi:arginine/lysine/ornithine decarboxylase
MADNSFSIDVTAIRERARQKMDKGPVTPAYGRDPEDAFFGRTEQVPVERAAGRVVAEMLTPYRPGIPVAVPGGRLNEPVVGYLRTGVAAGMVVPDALDPNLTSVRVLRE